MRKVIYGINLTADGCCDHTKGNGSEEIHEYFTELMQDVDLIIYGRKSSKILKSGCVALHYHQILISLHLYLGFSRDRFFILFYIPFN